MSRVSPLPPPLNPGYAPFVLCPKSCPFAGACEWAHDDAGDKKNSVTVNKGVFEKGKKAVGDPPPRCCLARIITWTPGLPLILTMHPYPITCPNHPVVAVLRSMAARWPALTKQGMNAEEEIAEMLATEKFGREREDRAYADHRCVVIRATVPPPHYDTAPDLNDQQHLGCKAACCLVPVVCGLWALL